MEEPASRIAECLKSTRAAFDTIDAGYEKTARIKWLERQLTSIINQLQAMLLDIELGLSLVDIGFFEQQDFDELMTDIEIQVENIKMQIKELLYLGR